MSIRLFVTGGTFDKEYNELTGELFFKDTHVNEMFKLGRCNLDISIRVLMMIDSLEMNDMDRNIIMESCKRCEDDQIIITHGTDTIVETGKLLKKANIEGKTIVLTGAMIPYKFGSSDGFFNLGSALGFVQSLEPGIYIAMNGRLFDPDNCVKNRKAGLLEELK